jgi:hypothetical protein
MSDSKKAVLPNISITKKSDKKLTSTWKLEKFVSY